LLVDCEANEVMVMDAISGLEPGEVKFAQDEIKRFDMDNSGKCASLLLIIVEIMLIELV